MSPEELRQQIRAVVVEHTGIGGGGFATQLTDDVLALPAIRRALATQTEVDQLQLIDGEVSKIESSGRSVIFKASTLLDHLRAVGAE